MSREFIAGVFCVISLSSFSQSAVPVFDASVTEADRMALIKTNVPLTEWHESSFWPQYHGYREDIRDVSLKEYTSVQQLAKTDRSIAVEEALNNGQNMIAFRLDELAVKKRYYAEIGLLHNGIIALKFLQTEVMLDMIESSRVYELTGLRHLRFHPDAAASAGYSDAKFTTLEKALSLSMEDALVFNPVYRQYEKELEELLGRQYEVYSLFAGEPSDFTPAIAKRQGYDLLALMEREVRLKEKYFNEIKAVSGPVLAACFLGWEDYYSLECKLRVWAEAR